MSAKKTGLGRGLESLIPTDILDESFDPTASQDEKISDLRSVKLSDIIADPDQPRRNFDEDSLRELSESIKAHGVLQPIVLRPYKGKFMIVAGERRFRAAGLAGLNKVPALIRTLTNQHKLELSLIENLQRRDLNPLETATAYLKLRDQFNLTLEEIGQRVGGKSLASISNTLRLLKLPEVIRKALAEGFITEGQARPLIGLDDKIAKELLDKILAEGWSARVVENQVNLVRRAEGDNKSKKKNNIRKIPERYQKSATRISKSLSTPVKIKIGAKQSGQIVITFKNEEELERLSKILNK